MIMIQKFIERVRQQSKTQSKNINISVDDAKELITELALLLLRENELLAEISKLKTTESTVQVTLDGGSFK